MSNDIFGFLSKTFNTMGLSFFRWMGFPIESHLWFISMLDKLNFQILNLMIILHGIDI